MRGAFFIESKFENCEFNNCSLITLLIEGCVFINCSFNNCRAFCMRLLDVQFVNCKLHDVNVRLSSFNSVSINNCVMGCLNLDEEVIFIAVTYNQNVIWPENFSPEAHGLILKEL